MNSPQTCQQTHLLLERQLLDEPLSPEERQHLSAHLAVCPDCGLEARVWEDMRHQAPGDAGTGELDALSGLARQALERARGTQAPASPRRRRWDPRLIWGVAGVAAAAVATVLVLLLFGAPLRKMDVRVDRGSPAPVSLALHSGDAVVVGSMAAAGQPIAPGTSLDARRGRIGLAWSNGTRVLLDRGAAATLLPTRDGSTRIRLRRGRLLAVVEGHGAGRPFVVVTRVGEVTVKGTRFWVNLSGATPTVGVLQGAVSMRSPKAAQAVTAGHLWSPSTGVLRALSEPEQKEHRQLAGIATRLAHRPGATLKLRSDPAGARVTLDGSELGLTPLVARIPPGPHRLELRRAGYRPVTIERRVAPGSVVAGQWSLEPLRAPPREPPEPPSLDSMAAHAPRQPPGRPSHRPSLAALLRDVRRQRVAGSWGGVVRTYRRLIRLYPRSREATTCLVPLGEALLTRRGDARGGLRSFDGYLKRVRTGGLALEARWGRIRALRRLGRRSQEIAALREFLRLHPKSFRAAAARARLQRLRAARGHK